MNLPELLIQLFAGGLFGLFGQVIRMFVGIAKSNAQNEEISLPRLFSSLAIGFTSGGIAIFSITKWQANPVLNEGEMLLLISIGYAGTDFLEGVFSAITHRFGIPGSANIDMEVINKQLAETEKRLQNTLQAEVKVIKAGLTSVNGSANNTGVTNFQLNYGPNANSAVISSYVEGVLKDILRRSGNQNAVISSTKRTPDGQARAMFTNIRKKGVPSQRKLYGPHGDRVIDTYERETVAGSNDEKIIQAMANTIINEGPEKFSKHLGDYSKLAAVDIRPSTVINHTALREAVALEMRNGRVTDAITDLINDPAFHLEIPNRETTLELMVSNENGHDIEEYC